MKTRYYCRNSKGRELFFVELLDEPLFTTMWLRFSFPVFFDLTKDMQRCIRFIEERIVKENLRIEMVDSLFKLVLKVPNIERVFFHETVLDSSGKLSEYNYNIQQQIIDDFIPDEYHPVTAMDGCVFESLSPYLYLKSQMEQIFLVTPEQFRQKVEQNQKLQNAYINLIDSTSKYFVDWFSMNGVEYEFYWMTCQQEPILYFICKSKNYNLKKIG